MWWIRTHVFRTPYLLSTSPPSHYGNTSSGAGRVFNSGYPTRIRLDQERSFLSGEFRAEAQFKGVELQFSGIESHKAIRPGEAFHYPLRRIYTKLREEHQKVTKEFTLRLAIKAINDTAGPFGLSHNILVYGIPSSFPVTNRKLLEQTERM